MKNIIQDLSNTPPQAIILLIVLGVITALIVRIQYEKDRAEMDERKFKN